jgi:hypothetical protein
MRRGKWRNAVDLHLQTLRSKVLAHGHQCDCNFTTDARCMLILRNNGTKN